jgi:hypothetical protein
MRETVVSFDWIRWMRCSRYCCCLLTSIDAEQDDLLYSTPNKNKTKDDEGTNSTNAEGGTGNFEESNHFFNYKILRFKRKGMTDEEQKSEATNDTNTNTQTQQT